MFLVNVNEALGYTHNETLDSSFAVIRNLLAEYNFMQRERYRDYNQEDSGDFEWVELPDFDNPGQMKRVKKYRDVEGFIR